MPPSKATPNEMEIRLPASAEDLPSTAPRGIGRYRLLKRLGAGGMGVVYAAMTPEGRAVAVKTVHAEYAENADFRARFAREVDLLRRVGGACVVPLIDADTSADRPWLVTPLIEGPTLGAHVREHGPLSPALLRGLAVGVAEALVRIHAQGVVHRDLKPANVILSPSGPKVLDFGIARAIDETALTRTGSVVGSSGWISPQHYRGEAATFADDMFAWGAVVAYAATGRPPFGGGAADAVAYRILHEEPDLTGFTGLLAALVRRALDKSAQERPSAADIVREISGGRTDSAEAATEAVTTLLRDGWSGVPEAPTRRYRVSFSPRPVRTRRGSGRALALGAGAVALLLTVVAGGWWLGRSVQDRAMEEVPPSTEGVAVSESEPPAVVTTPAWVGWAAEPDTPRPGDDAIGLYPFRFSDQRSDPEFDAHDPDFSGSEPMWARIADDAELYCAAVLCWDETSGAFTPGDVDASGYGTTPIQREDVFAYFDEYRPNALVPEVYVVAEVRYTVDADGIAEIIRLAEHYFP
ncbi:serine/threonine-protein kinase [Nocardiopsis sp. NPDC049922]|uniref:serine/threonine-protein kinase n=1 Tax=Nocardiopsis sp. NPDC049922 TaxID=3155157 RepID=UPI0033F61B3E